MTWQPGLGDKNEEQETQKLKHGRTSLCGLTRTDEPETEADSSGKPNPSARTENPAAETPSAAALRVNEILERSGRQTQRRPQEQNPVSCSNNED
jgi:hypothetical protein